MAAEERRVSATEARVRFGELLDGVVSRSDVVFVERSGREVAVVVSVEDWKAAHAGRSDKWERANAMLAEFHERLRVDGSPERLSGVDWEEEIRAGRDERDQQIWDALH